MQSFRTELENPVVERDIIELEKKIRKFKNGELNEEKFRSLRLARGIYGQRQFGVQMIRIKFPYGRITANQLRRTADVSDEYSTGKLHITTRQDLQIHYVSLDRTPELWDQLERDKITIREACGNTVRNVTASEMAGIDPEEPFDVTPYAHATFEYFLRNPIDQDMGRKFKIAFSSSEKDTGLTYMHDLGFIPQQVDGKRGFKVLLGGGLGSQPREADLIHSFLPEEQLIPFIESVIRVFDSYGEREKRMKARLKFLIKSIGVDEFLKLVEQQYTSLPNKEYEINRSPEKLATSSPKIQEVPQIDVDDQYENWKNYHVFAQKQEGLHAIGIKVKLGDFSSDQARKLAELIENYASGELRFTLRQNMLIRNVPTAHLPIFYAKLKELNFTNLGYNSTADITACPGTDTCNLGIASSTGIARELEKVLQHEYPKYLYNDELLIKISGCMNACGQHNMAHIGFQGMTMKSDGKVAPALQVLLGGGTLGKGKGQYADKVIKVPSKRGPKALRKILDDYEDNAGSLSFLDYYAERGKRYFYDLLKPLSSTDLLPEEFIDWGYDEEYVKSIGVGECAGVVIDLIATLLFEAEEKIQHAQESLEEGRDADAIYHAYNIYITAAKALLTTRDVKTNSKVTIVDNFEKEFGENSSIKAASNFADHVYKFQREEPTPEFAKYYVESAITFYSEADNYYKNSHQKETLENEK